MTRTGLTLDDLGGRLSWAALLHFVHRLPPDSALYGELYGTPSGAGADMSPRDVMERSAFASQANTNNILASIYDAMRDLTWLFECANTPKKRSRPRRIPPYPRPGVRDPDKGVRVIGRDPIRVADFDAWWDSKSAEKKSKRKRPGRKARA